MAKLIAQLQWSLVALALTHGKVWNTADPLTKLYCELDYLNRVHLFNIDNDTVRGNYISCGYTCFYCYNVPYSCK